MMNLGVSKVAAAMLAFLAAASPSLAQVGADLNHQAYHLLRHKQYEKARRLLDVVLAQDPTSLMARRYRAHALLKLGLTSQAGRDLAYVFACDQPLTEDFILKGDVAYYEARPEDALKAYRAALAQRPDSLEAITGATRAYGALGQVEAAETLCRKAILSANGRSRKALENLLADLRSKSHVAAGINYGG